jgi:uncharacterized membrane protein
MVQNIWEAEMAISGIWCCVSHTPLILFQTVPFYVICVVFVLAKHLKLTVTKGRSLFGDELEIVLVSLNVIDPEGNTTHTVAASAFNFCEL